MIEDNKQQKNNNAEAHEIKDFKKTVMDLNPVLDHTQDDGNSKKAEVKKPKRRTIRTYRDFALDALRGKPTSLANMIIQEKKKQEIQYNYSIKNKKNISMLVISVLVILFGVAAILFALWYTMDRKADDKKQPTKVLPKSLISFEYKKSHELDNESRRNIFDFVQETKGESSIPIGEIEILYFTKKDKDGSLKLAEPKDIFEKLDVRAPYQFTQNLLSQSTTGITSTIDGKSIFMIVKINNFDTTYQAMLSWEKNMLEDIGQYFDVNRKYFAQPFNDLIMYTTKDARVVLDDQANIVFGYSFIDSNTVLFFTDKKQFKLIIDTLRNNKEKE